MEANTFQKCTPIHACIRPRHGSFSEAAQAIAEPNSHANNGWLPTTKTAIVMQGTATVIMDNGSQVSLHPGDIAFFERGQGATWTVHENF